MREVITQFRASAVPPAELNRLMAEHLAIEHVRTFRRLLLPRLGLLSVAVLVVGIGFHWMSFAATIGSAAACAVLPLWAWIAEIRRDRALARRLDAFPGVAHLTDDTHDQQTGSEPCQKVVKSS